MTPGESQSMNTEHLGVVIPAYKPNGDRLIAYVKDLVETVQPARVRIELDSPSPGLPTRLREAVPSTVDVATASDRRGKGAAITAGFESLVQSADVEVLGFLDADASTPVEAFQRVLEALTTADVAVGSRRHPDARVENHQTVLRRLLGVGFAKLAQTALDVSLYDYQCGAKALTAEAWYDIREYLYTPGFGWDVELIAVANALSYTITEVPIAWNDRAQSTVSPVVDPLRMLMSLFRARHYASLARERPIHQHIDRVIPGRPLYRRTLSAKYP